MAKAHTHGSGWHNEHLRHSNAKRLGRAGGKYAEGTRFHIDTEFEGKRLVDDVSIYETPKNTDKKVLVYSPYLMSNILINKKDLPTDDDKIDGDGVYQVEFYAGSDEEMHLARTHNEMPDIITVKAKNPIQARHKAVKSFKKEFPDVKNFEIQDVVTK